MRIGFDAKKIVANLTGIGNYSRGTVNALATCCPGDEYLLFAPDKGNEQCRERLCLPSNTDFVYSHRTTSAGKEWWRCHGIVKDLLRCRLDVFHGLSNELPFGIGNAGCKSVVTIHDLIFLRYPQTYDWMARQILKSKTYYACCHADLIIAISQQTKRDIVRFYGISEDKIKVVYQGCDPIFYRTVGKDERKLYGKGMAFPPAICFA